VAVTTSLMQRLTPAEIEAVMAHEMSHVKNRDMLVITIASFLSTAAFFIVRNMVFSGWAVATETGIRGLLYWYGSSLLWYGY